MMIRVGRPLKKAWSLVGHRASRSANFPQPTTTGFPPQEKMTFPHTHTMVCNLLPGQWAIGEHGQKSYQTVIGAFHHPIDAVAHRLGDFLRARGFRVPPSEVINAVINEFNDTHSWRCTRFG